MRISHIPDSYGREFYALKDGSYFWVEDTPSDSA